MEEIDVGRVLAAAVPETVPAVADLPERARALGRRRRLRRAVATGGSAGVAVATAAGVVVALGGFGSAQQGISAASGGRPTDSPKGISMTTEAARPSPSASGAAPASGLPRPSRSVPSFAKATDDPVADAKLTAAVKAVLPPADQEGFKLYRAAGTANDYGAEFTWGSKGHEAVLDLSVGSIPKQPVPGTPTMCQTDPRHCTTGTATLQGHPVTWQYYDGDPSAPTLDITDSQTSVTYGLMVSGPTAPHLPGLDELKGIGLNDQVAAALLAAWPRR